MPIQECICNGCNQPFSQLTFRGDNTPPVCPKCKSNDIKTMPSQEGFMANSSIGAQVVGVPKGPS